MIVFDTETTGLGCDAEIIEIAVMRDDGVVLLNTLVKPRNPIPEDVIAIHSITNEMVDDAPRWNDILPFFMHLLSAHSCMAYNAKFDVRMLFQTGWVGNTPAVSCAMQSVIEDCNVCVPESTHFPLSSAAQINGVSWEGLTPHRAVSDCAVTLDIIRKLNGLEPVATGEHAREYGQIIPLALNEEFRRDSWPVEE